MNVEALLPANLCLLLYKAQSNVRNLKYSACSTYKWLLKYPVSKQNLLAIMPRRAKLSTIPFDV